VTALATDATAEAEDLAAPLYIAWQITNECNFACLHCIEESGPGKAFADELGAAKVFDILAQLMDHEVPYLSFSGGEPMLHPHFFEMVEHACTRGAQLKIETNGHYLSAENCARMKALGVKAVQVSLDGASGLTFNRMRVRGDFDRTADGLRNLHAAGVPIEINFSPASFDTPPATLLVLPNGWVKVAAALPEICADLRRNTLPEAWEAYRSAWRSDRVQNEVRLAVEDGSRHARANTWQLLPVAQA